VIHHPARPAVTITTRPLWRIRLGRELPRYMLCAMSVAGLAASARYAIAPVRPVGAAPSQLQSAPRDRAAEGYAVLFTRRYLTWNAAEPQASARALDAFVGAGMEPGAGLQIPSNGQQRVQWAEVVQERDPAPGEHVYTVAAQTDTAGLLYVSVTVMRTAGGLALGGYPAFVGAPASAVARPGGGHLQEVGDQALATVVERALRNYLAAAAGELAADLSNGAHVSLPGAALSLEAVQRLDWSADRRSVRALVQAQDGRGVQYALGYELDVVREQGRWEVSAVQMNPDE
jgi:Conjugative transposon protein TcpC